MRKVLLLAAACVVLGGTGHLPSPGAINQEHVRQLLTGIFDDVGAILASFEGGPEDPRSPVTNQNTLATDSNRLAAASHKADQLASELSKAQKEANGNGH